MTEFRIRHWTDLSFGGYNRRGLRLFEHSLRQRTKELERGRVLVPVRTITANAPRGFFVRTKLLVNRRVGDARAGRVRESLIPVWRAVKNLMRGVTAHVPQASTVIIQIYEERALNSSWQIHIGVSQWESLLHIFLQTLTKCLIFSR